MSIGDTHEPIEIKEGNTATVPPSAFPGGWSHWISPPNPSTGLLLVIIASLAAAIWNMNSKVTRLESQLANFPKVNEPKIRREMTGIVQRLSSLEAEKIGRDTEAVSNVSPNNAGEIAELQSSVTSFNDRLKAIEAMIDKHSREIADSQRKTKAISESIASLKTRIDKQLAAATNSRVNAGVGNAPPEKIPCQVWPW